MNRRGFLQSLLAGAAVLTVGQSTAIAKQVDALPEPAQPGHVASKAYVDSQVMGLNWRAPVKTFADLPRDPQEADAVFVEGDGWPYVYVAVDDVGWVTLHFKTL